MFEREMMILGLRRQRNLLVDLIRELEEKPALDRQNRRLYQERTREVTQNLRKLRKIKNDYFTYQESAGLS